MKTTKISYLYPMAILTALSISGCSFGGQTSSSLNRNTPDNQIRTNSTNGTSLSNNYASANATGTTPSSDQTSNSPFPNIIQLAMANFPNNLLDGAMAPTITPTDQSGSQDLFYETGQQTDTRAGTPGFKSNINVDLNTKSSALASFSSSTFDTFEHAETAWSNRVGNVKEITGSSTTLDLGNGIVGTSFLDAKSNVPNVVWSEGRWDIRVTETDGNTVPMAQVEQVVAYLHTHMLPVPQPHGAIIVSVSQSGIYVSVGWIAQNHLYFVNTQPSSNDPIETALAMAISMRPYPS